MTSQPSSSFTPGDIAQREHHEALGARRTAPVDLTMLVENNGAGDPLYIGLAQPGSATSGPLWQIRKFTYDGSSNLASVKYADGVATFTKAWDDRASYTY